MKMKKKLVSFLASITMIAAVLPTSIVSASYINDVKPVGLSQWGTATNYYSSDFAHSGNYSVYFGTAGSSYDANALQFPFKYALTSNQTYRLSFYTYRDFSNGEQGGAGGNIWLSNNQNLPQSSMIFYKSDGVTVATNHTEWGGNYQISQMDEDKVWAKTVVDFTPTADVTSFRINCWTAAKYFDDVCLQKLVNGVPTGENLIINGNLETILDYDDPYAKYPANWVGMINKKNDNSTDFTNNNGITSTDADAHSGSRSMLVNIAAALSTNVQMHATVNLAEPLKANTKYKISYWHKYPTGSNGNPMWSGLSTYSTAKITGNLWNDRTNLEYATVENGWRRQVYTWTNSEERYTIGFDWWDPVCVMLDDIQIFELDESGNAVKEVVVPNGGFEDYLDFAAVPTGTVYNDNWSVSLSGITDATAEDYVRYVDKGNGDYAMHLKYKERSAGDTFVMVTGTAGGNLTAGESYTVEYDTKYGVSLEQETIRMFPSAAFDYGTMYIDYHDLSYSPKSNEVTYNDGWYHVKKSFTASSSTQEQFTILIQAAGDMLIDNIKVYQTSDTAKTNLVADGDFSGTKTYNTTDLYNVVAYSAMAANTATVSWTNPHTEISDVVVNVNGEAVSATVDTTADAFNQILLEGLTAGETYNIEVSATINGETKTYNTSVTAAEERSWVTNGIDTLVSDNWSTILRDGTGYANTNVSIVEDADNSYVQFTGNIPTAPGNTYAGLQYALKGLDQSNYYKLTFKAKGENINNLHFMLEPYENSGLEFAHIGDVTDITDEWQTYEIMLDDYYTGTENAYDIKLQMISENFAGWFAIDDFEVYVYDAMMEETTGENLVENSTFDYVEPVVVMADPVLTLNGGTETTLKQGTMNVAVSVENVSDISLILALYKDDALKTVSIMEKTTDGSSQLYETGLIVPDMSDGVYTAKVMYWNSLTGLVPLRGAYEITE